jgi:hypothetical protein
LKLDGERWQMFGPIMEDSGPAMTARTIWSRPVGLKGSESFIGQALAHPSERQP